MYPSLAADPRFPAKLPHAYALAGDAPRDFRARQTRESSVSMGAQLRQQSPNSGLTKQVLHRALALVAAVLTVAAITNAPKLGFGSGSVAVAATFEQDFGQEVAPMPFERPGDSFPGSAFYYLAADPAPRLGETVAGEDTAQPATLDDGAHWDSDTPQPMRNGMALPNPGPAAKALGQAASGIDRERALSCLTAAIYFEAASEPDAGQRAVAQVVLNRVAHPSYPKTVCGVVYQGSERRTGCQFTFTCDGALSRKPIQLFWKRAEAVARDALAGFVYAPVGLATHYHTFAIHPYWADSLNFIGQIGAHRFYRFTGPAGSPNAFRFTYAGGEPATAAHARSASASNARDNAADPVALERAYVASLKAQAAQMGVKAANFSAPSYSSDEMRRGGDAAHRAANLPSVNTVKPEFQASGSWIGEPQ